jgi:hypothetical protein
MSQYETTGTYDSREEAIVAALDELTEPGQQLIVHAIKCIGPDDCTCKPLVWTYPE